MPIQKVETFGEKLRSLREEKELPLRKVAALLDIDQSTLSKIERNERKANIELIYKVSSVFHIDKKELLISFLSDKVAYELVEEECSSDILKAAEKKIYHLKKNYN